VGKSVKVVVQQRLSLMSEVHPMATDCNANRLCFEGFAGRQVVGDFGGGAITSNGGAVLLREADRAIGLSQRVAGCFLDARDQDSIVHRLETMIAQRVHAIALGYEDVNDHDELRHDPALALLSDTLEPKRAGVAALAGKSTLNRLEHGLKNTAGSDRYHKISVDDDAFEQVFSTYLTAATCLLPNFGRPTLMQRPAPATRSNALSTTCAGRGPRRKSGSGPTAVSAATT
jgi:hypothetical protein